MNTANNSLSDDKEQNPMSPEDIIFSDAQKEILKHTKFLVDLINSSRVRLIIIREKIFLNSLDSCFQKYKVFLDEYFLKEASQYQAYLSLLQKREVLIDTTDAFTIREKEFLRAYYQEKQRNFTAQCIYHYTQGIRDGIEYFSFVIHATKRNLISTLFHPDYRFDYLLPGFQRKYDHLFSLKSMEKEWNDIFKRCTLSDTEREDLFEMDPDNSFEDDKCVYLYDAGIEEGIKLISKYFLK